MGTSTSTFSINLGSVYLDTFCGCPYPCHDCCDAVCCYTGVFMGGDEEDFRNYNFFRSTYVVGPPPVTDGCPGGETHCLIPYDPVTGDTGLHDYNYGGNDYIAEGYVLANICFPCT